MGPLVVILVIGMLLLIATGAGMLAGGAIGSFLGRHSTPALRARFKNAGRMVPAVAAGYLVACAFVMMIISAATGRGLGIGDTAELPLPHGFQWSAIDDLVSAEITPPHTDIPLYSQVLSLQQSGDWLAGSFHVGERRLADYGTESPDRWFLLNTRTRDHAEVATEADLKALAMRFGLAIQLVPSGEFYTRQRYRWYDLLIEVLLILPLLFAGGWLFARARHLLRGSAANDAGALLPRSE